MKITVETLVEAELNNVWDAWNTPADIEQWNTAQEDWHTTESRVDLREGGTFMSRMEARDGSAGFDFEGTYTRIEPKKVIEYRMSDGREVQVEFVERPGGVLVRGRRSTRRPRTLPSCSGRAGRPSWTTSGGTSRRRAERERCVPWCT
jgi:uncharacterized protein YndB with AHSA1/START domain